MARASLDAADVQLAGTARAPSRGWLLQRRNRGHSATRSRRSSGAAEIAQKMNIKGAVQVLIFGLGGGVVESDGGPCPCWQTPEGRYEPAAQESQVVVRFVFGRWHRVSGGRFLRGKDIPAVPSQTQKSPSLAREAFSGGGTRARRPLGPTLKDSRYFGCCCWSALVTGAELLESCSRSFFSRLISTRPPLMCLVFAASSVGTGALPMPTR